MSTTPAVSDEQYAALSLREQATSIIRRTEFDVEPGGYDLECNQWGEVKADGTRFARWFEYAAGYPGGLVALQSDGTYTPWHPDRLAGGEG